MHAAKRNVRLVEVDTKNLNDLIRLQPFESQYNFVADSCYSLAEAYANLSAGRYAQPFGIYHDGEMVGYVMVIYDYDIPEYDVWHMMIDGSKQGNGYGAAALDRVLDYIKTMPFGGSDRVTLTCNKENPKALSLYKSRGFQETAADYMLTYDNYYGITKESDPKKYDTIQKSLLVPMLQSIAGAETDVENADLAACAETYLLDAGMTQAQLDALRAQLTAA